MVRRSDWWLVPWWLVVALLVLVVWVPAAAAELLEPEDAHYSAAMDRLLVERATDDILRMEVYAAELGRLLGQVARIQAEMARRRDAVLDEHARNVRAWAGHPEPAGRGSGWHEVTRHD